MTSRFQSSLNKCTHISNPILCALLYGCVSNVMVVQILLHYLQNLVVWAVGQIFEICSLDFTV